MNEKPQEPNYSQLINQLLVLGTKNSFSYYQRAVMFDAASAIQDLQNRVNTMQLSVTPDGYCSKAERKEKDG